MSVQHDARGLSRRVFLQALAMAPLGVGGGAASAMSRLAAMVAPRPGQSALPGLGAREAVERIRDGSITAESLAAALLERGVAHEDLNVANAIDPSRVLEAARAVDRRRAAGDPLGPAAGLPFGVKDQIAVAGYPATGGNGALRGYVPERSAVVVDRLVAAGAIPFCMTSLPDMVVPDGIMHQVSSHSDDFGAVRNPYDRARIPGGSSGGSAAALAARIVPAALGLDTNGSVRIPSAFCGVAGLRPSTFTLENALRGTRRKRYADDGVLLPPVGRLDTIGPMARTVADVAFLDTLVTGEPVPEVDLRAVRIAVPRPDSWERDPVDPDVAQVIRDAFARLRDAGCRLVEIDFDAEVRSIVGRIGEPTPATILAEVGLGAVLQSPETREAWLRENAPDVTLERLYRGRPMRRPAQRPLPPADEQVRILEEAARRYADVYRSHGVAAVAFPTVPILPTPIRADGPREPLGELLTVGGRQIEEGRAIALNVFIAPRLGAPGLSLPAGLARGLPVGLELDALPGRDTDLLGLGMAVERVLGPIPPPALS